MELGLRTMAAAGAQHVMTTLNSPEGRFAFDQPGSGAAAAAPGRMGTTGTGAAASFETYLAGVQQTGFAPLQLPLFCAHQMGTCRLGEGRLLLLGFLLQPRRMVAGLIAGLVAGLIAGLIALLAWLLDGLLAWLLA